MELLEQMERRARDRLPAAVYDYVAGGAGDESTLRGAGAAWRRHVLRPAALRSVPSPDLAVDLLGARLSLPVLLAPLAAQRMLHPGGEGAAAGAAARAGTVYCLPTRATTDVADLAREAGADGPRWFQLYVTPDRERSAAVLRRVAGAGFDAVVLTVDVPVGGVRDRERRHGPVPLPDGVRMATHLGPGGASDLKPDVGGWAPDLRWEDIAWVAEVSGLPVLVKGVLHPVDAELAVAHGAAGLIVSTHGGRQLDSVVPTADALPAVAAAVGGHVPVLVDGGIRDGGDVVRALALGATAVLVGRPFAWGLAAGGAAGVAEVLEAFADGTAQALALVGSPSAAAVAPSVLG